jgi:hypothetical protein
MVHPPAAAGGLVFGVVAIGDRLLVSLCVEVAQDVGDGEASLPLVAFGGVVAFCGAECANEAHDSSEAQFLFDCGQSTAFKFFFAHFADGVVHCACLRG